MELPRPRAAPARRSGLGFQLRRAAFGDVRRLADGDGRARRPRRHAPAGDADRGGDRRALRTASTSAVDVTDSAARSRPDPDRATSTPDRPALHPGAPGPLDRAATRSTRCSASCSSVAPSSFSSRSGSARSTRAGRSCRSASRSTAQRGALRRQREFAADASHELRTPLTVIRARGRAPPRHRDQPVARPGTRSTTSTPRSPTYVARRRPAAARPVRLRRGRLDRQPLDLGDVAAAAASSMAKPAGGEGVRVVVDPEPAMVEGDSGAPPAARDDPRRQRDAPQPARRRGPVAVRDGPAPRPTRRRGPGPGVARRTCPTCSTASGGRGCAVRRDRPRAGDREVDRRPPPRASSPSRTARAAAPTSGSSCPRSRARPPDLRRVLADGPAEPPIDATDQSPREDRSLESAASLGSRFDRWRRSTARWNGPTRQPPPFVPGFDRLRRSRAMTSGPPRRRDRRHNPSQTALKSGRWDRTTALTAAPGSPPGETPRDCPSTRTRPTSPTGPAAANRRRWLVIIAALVVLVALFAGWMGISYLFLRPAAPGAVGLADLTRTVTASASSDTPSASATADPTEAPSDDAASAAFGLWARRDLVGRPVGRLVLGLLGILCRLSGSGAGEHRRGHRRRPNARRHRLDRVQRHDRDRRR